MCVRVPTAAQGTTSRVVGTVTDTTGAVIPGATVLLSNDETGVTFETVTTATGAYVVKAVQVGQYTVTVQLPGFKKFVTSGNRVTIGEPATINAVLETGSTRTNGRSSRRRLRSTPRPSAGFATRSSAARARSCWV